MPEGPRPEIERALRYIAEHLDRPISVAEVAQAARLSPFHLHREARVAATARIGHRNSQAPRPTTAA